MSPHFLTGLSGFYGLSSDGIWQNQVILKKKLKKLKKVAVNDQEKIAVKILLDHIGEKTLVIIAENIGHIFNDSKGFGKEGQQKIQRPDTTKSTVLNNGFKSVSI